MTYVALFGWPVVVMWLFRRFDVPTAVAVSVIGGYLLLPHGFSIGLPALPDLDKTTMSVIPAMILAGLAVQRANRGGSSAPPVLALPGWIPQSRLVLFLLGLLLFGVVMTVMTNGDRLVYGWRALPGLRLYDGFSMILNTLVMLLPFLLGRRFLAHPENHQVLLRVLCLAGVCYALLALYEVRMSPQLSNMVYGYFPHNWLQHKRGGGWRPIVFLEHGLWLGIFLCCTLLAAAALFRAQSGNKRTLYLFATIWLFFALFLAKSFGAFLIALALLPVILFFPARFQLLVAAGFAGILILYPMLRGAGLIPVDWIMDQVRLIDQERAASLSTRLVNETRLLDKANERALFGWGGWGRNRVYTSGGGDMTISDGYWIILITAGGWTRYIAVFGLMGLAIILFAFRKETYTISRETAALCLIMTANLIDLIPNGTFTPLTMLLAGALMGRLELGRVEANEPAQPGEVPVRRAGQDQGTGPPVAAGGPQYSRFSPSHDRGQHGGQNGAQQGAKRGVSARRR